jgi:hypothetical protein
VRGFAAITIGVIGCSSSNGATPAPQPLPTTDKATAVVAEPTCPAGPRDLGPGITHERVDLVGDPVARAGDDCLDVVRIDLGGYRLAAHTALRDGGARPMPRWLDERALVAGINAGMFHDDLRSVGMLVTADDANNPDDNPAFGGFLAFDPVDPASPPAVITGRDCAGFDLVALRARYRGVVQSYRLLGCSGDALPWRDTKHYSAAAIGVDHDDRLVLLHARAPHRMTDVAATTARLDLAGAIFVEGGPEATLIVRGRDGEVARVGSYESRFVENDDNRTYWDLPNIVGVARIEP